MSIQFKPVNNACISWKNGIPYSNDYQDIYFSIENGLKESLHVFIQGNQLIERWSKQVQDESFQFVIGEIGFGSGLNFLISWALWEKHAPKNARLHYYSVEKNPLSYSDLEKCIKLWPSITQYGLQLLESYPILTPGMHTLHFSDNRVNLHLMLDDALSAFQNLLICGDPNFELNQRQAFFDAWFLDGFSPKNNPDAWSDELFATLSMLSNKNTTLSSFSVAGKVKRSLQDAGFKIQKSIGFGLKKNNLIGTWEKIPASIVKRNTPWHVGYQNKIANKQAIVIGAGLAGACIANALAHRGWKVKVLDSNNAPGQGASGNHHAILFPNLSAYAAPLTEFMLSTYLYAHRFYQNCINKWDVPGEFEGILQLDNPRKPFSAQKDLEKWLTKYPDLGQFVNDEQASKLSGVEIKSDALFIPLSGWIDSPALCAQLIHQPHIEYIANTTVQTLLKQDEYWYVDGHQAEIVIIANGYQANQFMQTQYLAIQPIRGQMTYISCSNASQNLRIPLCGEGHILPGFNNMHGIGATYGLTLRDADCQFADDEINFYKINRLPINLGLSLDIKGNWAAVRAGTLDHLPIVGPIADSICFNQDFQSVSADPNRWLPSCGKYVDGLYILSGFGSRGITTIPLSAEYLATIINREVSILPRSLMESISPARFLLRSLVRGTV